MARELKTFPCRVSFRCVAESVAVRGTSAFLGALTLIVNPQGAREIMNETPSTPEATDKGEAPSRSWGDTRSAVGSWLDESIRVRPYTTLAVAAILGLALGTMWRR